MAIELDLRQILQPGQGFSIFYGEGNLNNTDIQIRAIIDEDQIVYRTWSNTSQCWNYFVKEKFYFEILNKEGYLVIETH